MRRIATLLSILFVAVFLWVVYSSDTGQQSALSRFWATMPYSDKLGHFLLFGILTIAANILTQFRLFTVGRWPLYRGSLLVSIVAIIEELSQFFFPLRTVDVLDLAAGFLGILLASLISRPVSRLL